MSDAVVLFEPTRLRPSDEWIANALLVAEQVASIDPATVGRKDSRLESLRQAGAWVPAEFPDRFDDIDALIDEAIRLVGDRQTAVPSNRRDPRDGWIYRKKLPMDLQHRLYRQDLLLARDDGTFEEGIPGLVHVVLDLCGRAVVRERSADGWVLDVESAHYARNALAADATTDAGGLSSEDGELIELHHSFPRVAPETAPEKVLDFREKHRTEFEAFQAGLRELMMADEPEHRLTEFAGVVGEFTKASESFGLRVRMGSRVLGRRVAQRLRGVLDHPPVRSTSELLLVASVALDAGGLVEDVTNPDAAFVAGGLLGITRAAIRVRAEMPTTFLSMAAKSGLTVPVA